MHRSQVSGIYVSKQRQLQVDFLARSLQLLRISWTGAWGWDFHRKTRPWGFSNRSPKDLEVTDLLQKGASHTMASPRPLQPPPATGASLLSPLYLAWCTAFNAQTSQNGSKARVLVWGRGGLPPPPWRICGHTGWHVVIAAKLGVLQVVIVIVIE